MKTGYNATMPTKRQTESDPVIEFYKEHIDRTLIRKNLRLTIEERLNQLMKLQEFAEELRRSGTAARRHR
jgi:hypothetical protein